MAVQNRAQEDKERRKPREERLTRAHPFNGDLRNLPRRKPVQRERPELNEPEPNPVFAPGTTTMPATTPSAPQIGGPSAPAPAPLNIFEGLDRFNWGAGSPPDTNGDVGPNYYIQTVNTSIGVFRKSDGFQVAAFTFDTFMSQGSFGNLCDTNNFGDPVVLYDTFEDRWIITDFAFVLDASNNVVAPAYQCIAASKTGDPVTGGWNFYSIKLSDNLGDYPKFGIWPDGLYMSANLFSFGAGSSFKGVRVFAFDKAQMYAGSPTVKIASFDVGGGDFTILPSNARLQTGTPPVGRPNLFISTQMFLNALTVYKFHVDWNSISLSTFTGPDIPISATSWPTFAAGVPQPSTATLLDSLSNRAMVQNQYTNFTGTESLWVSHTVRRQNTSGFAAPRWYQVNVTGGTVATPILQATTWDPDGANVLHRWMPSLALDRAGDLAMGYSTSNSTTAFPSMAYAGRLAGDPVNTFSKTEQTFFTGTASQTGSTRWGDYSAMTLDPDGCTFWYTTEYANPADQTFNHRWLTKFGSFRYTECVPVGAGGTISGTVTTNPGGAPIVGATVELGARSTTTNGSGNYSFNSIPAGTYPSMTASFPGYVSASASSIVVTDGGTTTQDFSLAAAPASACLTDTTQSDFLAGVSTNLDLNTSPGNVTLTNAPTVDQSNSAGTTTGTGFGATAWTGQTFIPAVTGLLVKADVQLFCNGCGATPPNLTLSVRNTSAGLPTGADLASATIPGSAFASGSTATYTASFGSPATLTSGTQYALILRPVSAPAGSGYFWIRSSPSTYANGSRVLSADSGGTWSADTTRDYNFKTYIQTGYAASGNLVSSPKDANPAGGFTPIWSTFSWNATVPANTSLKFQLAGSNNVNGPFNFVGPDGTAATFFTTSPVSLSPQFYNLRFLEYKAFFATTDPNVTPTLNDATTCFSDVDCSTSVVTITPTPASVCTSTVGNTASGPAGMTSYSWSITNGTITSATNTQTIIYTAGAAGSVTLSLTVTEPNGCIVSGSTPVTINPTPPTPTISGTLSFCTGFSTTLSSSAASGNQWYLNGNPIGGATSQNYVATAGGSYTVQVIDGNGCSSAMSAPATVVKNSPPPVPTVNGTTNGTGTQDQACPEQPLTLTATSAGATSYQWYQDGNPISGQTSSTTIVTTAGNYTVTASANCTSAQSATYVVQNPTPHKPVVTPSGPTTFCTGGSVTLQSNSPTGIQWYLNGNPIGGATSQNYVATASGTYTAQLNALGCHSTVSDPIVVTVNPIPATPTITPSGQATLCNGSVTLSSSSATGNQWYLNGNPIGGATSQTYSATATGNYTVVVTTSGCSSAASSTTTVVANPVPVLTYATPSAVVFNNSLVINPATGPSDNTSVSSISVQSTGTYTGTINVNNTTGVVSISNAAPAGTHTITIRATDSCGASTNASFTLTVNKATPTLTWNNPANIVYGTALGGTQLNASASVPGGFVYTPSAGTVLHVGNSQTLHVDFTPTDTTDYNTTSKDVSINVTKATLTITADDKSKSYRAANPTLTYTPSGFVNNDTASVLSGVPNITTTATTTSNVNGYPITITQGTLSAADYTFNFVSGTLTVTKATPVISWSNPADIVFGTALGAAQLNATASNPNDSSSVTGSFVYNPASGTVLNAGNNQTLSVGFTPTDATNYNSPAQKSVSINVLKATPPISLSNLSQTYDGTPKAPTAVTTPSGLSVTFTYTQNGSPVASPTNVGNYNVTATINDPNYQGSTSGILVINQGTPVITWNNPANIVFGTPLSSTQLNATANVGGTFAYTPPSGTVLNVGSNQLSVTFTPTDTTNYTTASKNVSLTVDPVTATVINLSSANYIVNEGDGRVTITVNRTGNTAASANVDYTTSDTAGLQNCNVFNGIASSRCDYATSVGTLHFAAGETSKTILIPLVDDSYAEGSEIFNLTLSNAVGESLGAVSVATITIIDNETVTGTNPIDNVSFFVREHYIDFLGREPEPNGFTGWQNILNNCPQGSTQCDRIEVSSDFFRSEEFQNRGYFIYRFYSAVGRIPHYAEFMPDFARVSGFLTAQQLEDNKVAFIADFMGRTDFQTKYGSLSDPTAYVTALLNTVGLPNHPSKAGWIAGLANNSMTQAQVLRALVESSEMYTKYYNEAFVIMQYFGYLRRDADSMYVQWLQTLNSTGDYRMLINGFLNSVEYRMRFGP
jgi:hypothetical protein